MAWSAAYYGFGQTIASGGSTGNHYQWGASSGYRSDGFGPADAAPLQKVGARYYDPELGVFLTRDTVLSQKPYAYCDGDPVNFSDPSGHLKIPDWLKKLWQNIASVSSTVKGAVTGGLGALSGGFGAAALLDKYNNQHINNQGLANERTMLNNYYNTHDNPDMTRQWELYQYMQNGTLKADAGFAAQAGDAYLHGLGGAR